MSAAMRTAEADMGRLFVPARDSADDAMRDNPTPGFDLLVRSAFPTEREYEKILRRKLARRGSGPYRVPALEDMAKYVQSFLRDHIAGEFTVSEGRWLTGGASKIQFAFTLDWTDPAVGPASTPLVVRMEPAESLNATSRLREFQIIKALRDVLPVPRTYWVDAEGSWFPEPAIVYGFVSGTTKPSGDRLRVSGTGTRFPEPLRAKLAPQFVTHLATIHTFDITSADLDAFDVPAVGTTQSARWQLNRVMRVWEEDRGEDLPVVESIAHWLEDHLPVLDTTSVLHGDYRAGNFLFEEDTGRITGWLDWERGYLGDRHRDLAWTMLKLFGHPSDDGSTLMVNGLIPEAQFLEDYQAQSGLEVDPARLHYYRVFNSFQMIVSNLATGYRIVRLQKSHQDVLIAFVEGAVYALADEVLRALEDHHV